MNKKLIQELRLITGAGISDCVDALKQGCGDLQKAVDIVKVKGLNIVSGREGKVASEGRVTIFRPVVTYNSDLSVSKSVEMVCMIEINCQTDFVANSKEFVTFTEAMAATLAGQALNNMPFEVKGEIETLRQQLVAATKENVVVRRWWVEEALNSKARVFEYTHSNNKIGVLLTLVASTEEMAKSPDFNELGSDLAMQVAAMNPSAVSVDRLDPELVTRQKTIFETQLTELNKPQAAWPKILEGKFNKWHTEVCLLNQESVVVPKTTVQQVIANVAKKLGGEIQVVNFIRCQVGEGIEKEQGNFAEEVAKMI